MADILLLNDTPAQNLWWQRTLGAAGHELRCVTTVLAARRSCRMRMPDLLLVELLHWQGNGFSLASALEVSAETAVVLLSMRQLHSDRLWADCRGIDLVLPQPMSTRAIRASLAALLSNRTKRCQ